MGIRSRASKRSFWIVSGYGVPADIMKDANYDAYLHSTFNLVWDDALQGSDVAVIMSGGRTDMRPPYRRLEAVEMRRAFSALMGREAVRARASAWSVRTEKKALSTLDNLLNTKRMIGEAHLVHVVCEATRAPRMRKLARAIFGKAVQVHPIDFDRSANRYADAAFLRQKERRALVLDFRALRDAAFRRRLHAALRRRIAFLRGRGAQAHVAAVREWWENELQKLER